MSMSMGWITPNRRELVLLLFSLSIYTFSYNFDNSIRLLGIDASATQGAVLSRLGFSNSKLIDKDGRKPRGWRDSLEDQIFGKWKWDEGHVAGDGEERAQLKGTGIHGAMWMGKRDSTDILDQSFEHTTVNQALRWWHEDVPQTTLVKHVPGYTILDNVIIFNGTTFIITDDLESFPALPSIVTTTGPRSNKWEIISRAEAFTRLGAYGGMLRDVTWMSTDTSPHNSTLFALWRMYSSVDESGQTTLPPPRRLVFPNNRFFSDANPSFEEYWIRRTRTNTGFHPYLAKAAFPHLTVMYQEDWEDYHLMAVPFVLERVVIADRQAAAKELHLGQPIFSAPFEMGVSEHWWEPVRRTLVSYFDADEEKNAKKVVTYLHTQGDTTRPKLREEDHQALVQGLRKMEQKHGYEVHVISCLAQDNNWNERMNAIVRSTVVLGVYGDILYDSAFMKRSSQATLMEFFPTGTFSRDQEVIVQSLGIQYIAWWDSQKFTADNLPPVASSSGLAVPIDAKAVMQGIQKTLSR